MQSYTSIEHHERRWCILVGVSMCEGADAQSTVVGELIEVREPTKADQVGWLDEPLLQQVDQPSPASDNLRFLTITGKGGQCLVNIRRFKVAERDHDPPFPSAA